MTSEKATNETGPETGARTSPPAEAPTPAPRTGLLRALRLPVGLAWIASAAAFALPDGGIAAALRLVFVGLLVVHTVECVVFLPALRASGRPLAGQLLQVMLFGVVHYGLLQAEQAASADSGS